MAAEKSYTYYYKMYREAHPEWSESVVKQWARNGYNAQFVNNPAESVPSTSTPMTGPTIGGETVNNTGAGTIGPSDAAKQAASGFTSGKAGTTKSNTGAYEGTVTGIDPTTGLPVKSSVSFKQGSEATLITGLPPKDRIALQKKMAKLNLYPSGYTPAYNGIVTQEDFDAIKKLQIVGTQLNMGDINDVIAKAQKDPKLASVLATGGYSTGTKATLTDTTEAASTLNDFFLNLFNEKPSKQDVKDYQNALNAREKTAKGGMSAQERQDILYNAANKRLASLSSGALTGDVKASEALTEGQLGKRIRELRQAYQDNGMTVSDKTLYKLAGQSFRSQEAYDNIVEDINQNVGLQWGQLGQNLKPGQTVRNRLQPYISVWSNLSGIPEDEIKTSDLQDVMNQDGSFKNVQQYKAVKYKSKEYLASDNFKQTVFDDTTAVLRNFGIG